MDRSLPRTVRPFSVLRAPLAAGLVALGLLAPVGAAQEASAPAGDEAAIVIEPERVRSALTALGGDAPADLEPVTISETELRRALVYTLGTTELEARKIDVFIDEEIRAQIAAGAAEGDFRVSDEEVAAAVQETLDQIEEQYPTLDPESVLDWNNVPMGGLGRMTAQSKLFERVFLPDDPAEWPATTREAIRANAGEEFLQKLEEGYEQRKAAQEAAGDQAAAGQAMFQMLMRQMVMQALNRSAEVLTASDGLPADVAMRVNGVDILTDEIYALIEDRITEADRERAERWATKTALIEAVLAARGDLLTGEAFEEAYAEHAKPYEGSPISLEVIARNFKGFPSMEAYRKHFQLQESYQRSIADEITDEALQEHLQRAQRLLGVGSVDVEVILCSAFDFPSKQWLEDGWQKAADEARTVARGLAESEGEAWGALLEEHSDFWDPPAPTNPVQQQQAPKKKNQGRFGTLNRNELLQYLSESDYSHFVDGYSVADAIFFDLEPGQVGGPWKGPYGYYFARVKRRIPPARPKTLADQQFRDMVVQDYVAVRFNGFARAVQEAATGSGQ